MSQRNSFRPLETRALAEVEAEAADAAELGPGFDGTTPAALPEAAGRGFAIQFMFRAYSLFTLASTGWRVSVACCFTLDAESREGAA